MSASNWHRRTVLGILPALLATPALAQGLAGDWEGVLIVGGPRLRIRLHLTQALGGIAATMDSPDQGAWGLAASAVEVDGSKIKITWAFGIFEGTQAGDILEGTWIQGSKLSLKLARIGSKAAADLVATAAVVKPLDRPQVPKAPFPYTSEDVEFDNPTVPGVRLAGTLTLPPGKGPFPTVVLIAGSGPNNRDERLLDHPVFLVLADWLTRQGIAVLRYDKRGVAGSKGDYLHATSTDFASDVDAALGYLRGRKDIDRKRLGLVGHSEGGYIAPMVAAKDPKVAFIVLMAGPAVLGSEILALQGRLIAQASGTPTTMLDSTEKTNRATFEVIRTASSDEDAYTKARAVLTAGNPTFAPAMLDAMAKQLSSPWMRFMLSYDPAIDLRKVRCPVLAINGSKDLQVPASQNLPAMRASLSHNRDATILELPGLNHIFQTATTGSPTEYGEITETISPVALKTISDWIVAHTKA